MLPDRSAPLPLLLPAVTSAGGHLPVRQRNVHKEHGIWIYKDCDFKPQLCELEQIAQPLGVGFLIREENWED